MSSNSLLLLALLCAFHHWPLCEAAVCYVKPTEPHNTTCPSEPCYTLDEYVSNSTEYFVSNTVFLFLGGHHNLSHSLNVSGVHNITLKLCREKSRAVIFSKVGPSFRFESAFDVDIRDLTFQAIGITFDNGTSVTLTGLKVFTEYSANIFVLINMFGSVSISQVTCELYCLPICTCIAFEWTVVPLKTLVLLSELELTGNVLNRGISISGCTTGEIVLRNSNFSFIEHGVNMNLGASCNDLFFMCENTVFHKVDYGLNITVPSPQCYHEYTLAVTLYNVSFLYGDLNVIHVILENIQNATISNCNFEGSVGAIWAINSVLSLIGNVTFKHCIYLGAISLVGDSRILIPEPRNTYILFENNTTLDVGGAIHFYSAGITTSYCRIFVEQSSTNNPIFSFSNNAAVNGGNAIYGAYLDGFPCYSPNGTLITNLSEVILSVSSFSPSFAQDPSVISSDALNLCFCNVSGKQENCSWTTPSIYPGQVFEVSVAALGDMDGLVKWPVYVAVSPGSLGSTIQQVQYTNAERCTNFQYSILSSVDTVLTFSLDFKASHYSIDRNVRVLNCPLGFAFSTKHGCKCREQLQQIIICNITRQTIQRKGTTWIGLLMEEDNSTLAFSTVCPFHYCITSSVDMYTNTSFLDEDIQCAGNRSGRLCGSCGKNLSLALGSNRCLPGCSDNNFSLIVAFVVAGIALVFFIKILNLTVSQGTINGVIFYANTVGAEQAVLFSSGGNDRFLSVFIAWVNLDLGIETCFFEGMDAYIKAWLQFVFPVYVWAIALFIIILSHYSIYASKVFGNNSVPVLATLFLLSYSKLLRAVISALSITDIQFLNGSAMSVWERNGSIQYLTGKHIPLFVFAVAVLILLWFPFTLILVSIQWLQKGTHNKVLHWVTKIIPFIDAFTGPLKDKHRFWVGALLLVRCVLLLFFYIYTANGNGVAFVSISFAVIIILVFLAVNGFVYKNYYLAVLETSYFLNLGVLAIGTLYVQYVNGSGSQEALVITSVGIAFLQFIATVIYHAFVQLREPLKKLKVKVVGADCQGNAGNINEPEHDEYEPLCEPIERPPYHEIGNFREPLLAYLND